MVPGHPSLIGSGRWSEQVAGYCKPGVRSPGSIPELPLTLPEGEQASELYCKDVLQDLLVQTQIRDQCLQPFVLVLQSLQLAEFGHTQVTKLFLPSIE